MTQKITVVMYHYIRELQYTKYPAIKALLSSEFKDQLKYLKQHFSFITIDDCLNAIYGDHEIPNNSCLLTFDDGYIDHFITVFPLLNEMKIQGCFFPPAKAILTSTVLDVNKIHFILASMDHKIPQLIDDIYYLLNEHRDTFNLQSNDYYYSKLAQKSRFDTADVIFIKRLLQVELNETLRNTIVDYLFQKYVSTDETSFSKELYMDTSQIRYMAENGMYIGSHGYEHYWLNQVPKKTQESEINQSLEFLKKVNAPTKNWAMCYPYGGYNESLIDVIKSKGCALAFTTHVDKATVSKQNAFTLQRFDTNDFPPKKKNLRPSGLKK